MKNKLKIYLKKMKQTQKPKISCYCCTYGRPNLLEEAIYSFLMQSYQNKELIIINDHKDQKLIFEHPQVKIFNINERIIPLGKKYNFAVKHCKGEIIMPWDDDDVYLPWKMEFSLKNMKKGIFHTDKAFLEMEYKKLQVSHALFQCNFAIDKMLFNEVKGYPETEASTLDQDLYTKLKKLIGENISQKISNKDLFYVYRWGSTNSWHHSAIKEKTPELVRKNIDQQLKETEILKGEIKLKPHWKYDYVKECQELVKKSKLD